MRAPLVRVLRRRYTNIKINMFLNRFHTGRGPSYLLVPNQNQKIFQIACKMFARNRRSYNPIKMHFSAELTTDKKREMHFWPLHAKYIYTRVQYTSSYKTVHKTLPLSRCRRRFFLLIVRAQACGMHRPMALQRTGSGAGCAAAGRGVQLTRPTRKETCAQAVLAAHLMSATARHGTRRHARAAARRICTGCLVGQAVPRKGGWQVDGMLAGEGLGGREGRREAATNCANCLPIAAAPA
jgi:hypothetical protein